MTDSASTAHGTGRQALDPAAAKKAVSRPIERALHVPAAQCPSWMSAGRTRRGCHFGVLFRRRRASTVPLIVEARVGRGRLHGGKRPLGDDAHTGKGRCGAPPIQWRARSAATTMVTIRIGWRWATSQEPRASSGHWFRRDAPGQVHLPGFGRMRVLLWIVERCQGTERRRNTARHHAGYEDPIGPAWTSSRTQFAELTRSTPALGRKARATRRFFASLQASPAALEHGAAACTSPRCLAALQVSGQRAGRAARSHAA